MRVGVTGASGFLGSILTQRLAFAGHSVRALRRTLPSHGAGNDSGVSWYRGDLASPHDAAAFVDGLDAIVHLAWVGTPLTSNAHLPSDASANMLPTLTLLEALRASGTRSHLVFASSGGAVYGPSADNRPFNENDVCRPQSSYGIEKVAAEEYLRMAVDQSWLTATVLRIGNPYGVLLPPERLQGFIGTAIAQLRAGYPIRVFGNPANIRDYLHLDDMCCAFELALGWRTPFDTFNVGSGEGHSVVDVLRLIEELAGRPVATETGTPEAADRLPSWVVLDVHKARDELGWKAEIPLRDGIRRVLEEAPA
jgi:UDP-glucose 4-epimerase